MINKTFVVVVGPTAVGKTDFCVQLAKEFLTDILSMDSRQFYRELSIGTAKPSAAEQQGVTHHFINSHSILEEYNAGSFEQDALQLLDALFKEHSVVIATGGSGLYVRALCQGLDSMPETSPEVRGQLNNRLAQEGLPALAEELQKTDPEYATEVDLQNPQRVIRALEVFYSSGKPYSTFRNQAKTKPRPFNIIKIGLTRDRPELYERINQRMDLMLELGLLDEVKRVLPYQHHQALQTVGYTELFGFLAGAYDMEEAIRLLKRNSRRYAKRQMTWFNRDSDITWFHPAQYAQALKFIQEKVASKK